MKRREDFKRKIKQRAFRLRKRNPIHNKILTNWTPIKEQYATRNTERIDAKRGWWMLAKFRGVMYKTQRKNKSGKLISDLKDDRHWKEENIRKLHDGNTASRGTATIVGIQKRNEKGFTGIGQKKKRAFSFQEKKKTKTDVR